jgi:hypothetical protein
MKKTLTLEALESETALELPNRDMFLVTVVIANSLNDVIDVDVRNVNVAVQVCAIVELINVELLTGEAIRCTIRQ